MTDYFKGLYIAQLSEQRQDAIETELSSIGLSHDDIEAAMCSRVCDLIDTIDVNSVLGLN